MNKPSTVKFLELHTMLLHRKIDKLTKLGYVPIYTALQYIMYTEIYNQFKNKDKRYIYEDHVVISYDTPTGIAIQLNLQPNNCIRYILDKSTYTHHWNNICFCLSVKGFAQLLREVHELKCDCHCEHYKDTFYCSKCRKNCILNYNVADWTAYYGQLECLKYLCQNNRVRVLEEAVHGGHLHCIKYLQNKGCPTASSDVLTAAESGHLDCMVYLYETCRIWPDGIAECAAKNKRLNILTYLRNYTKITFNIDTLHASAQGGCIKCLKYINQICDIEIDKKTIEMCALYGNFECLEYSLKNSSHETNQELGEFAIIGGNLDCIRYICEEKDSGLTTNYYIIAAKNGRLDILELLNEIGCPHNNKNIMIAAVSNNHFACLKFLHENAFPYDRYIINHCSNDKCRNYIKNVMFA